MEFSKLIRYVRYLLDDEHEFFSTKLISHARCIDGTHASIVQSEAAFEGDNRIGRCNSIFLVLVEAVFSSFHSTVFPIRVHAHTDAS